MKKRTVQYTCFLLLICIFISSLYLLSHYIYNEKQVYEQNWNLCLPEGMAKIYKASSKNAMGDGVLYTVFKLDDEANQYFGTFPNRKETIPQDAKNEIGKMLSYANTNQEEYPDFSETFSFICMCQEDGSKLYILYSPTLSKAFFVQIMI